MYSFNIFNQSIIEYIKGNSFTQIGRKFKITRQTISNWYKLYVSQTKEYFNDQFKRMKILMETAKQQTSTLTLNMKIFLSIEIHKNPFLTQKNLISIIKNEFNVCISLYNIQKFLKEEKYTYKRVSRRPIKSQKHLDDIINNRQIFNKLMQQVDINKIISIDEMGISDSKTFQKVGLSKKGKQINVPISTLTTKRENIIMAISTFGIIHQQLLFENVNGDIYEKFIENTIIELNKKEMKGYTFIFDNVSFHKRHSILEKIINSGNMYAFIPQYSPNNNPIETCFGLIKQQYKKNNINKITKTDSVKCKQKEVLTKQINVAINQFKENYQGTLEKIFKRSIMYDYTNMENELRDRFIVVNT